MLFKTLLGFLALMLAVVPVQAADDRATRSISEGAGDVGTEAFVTPPTGFTPIYFFTGAFTSGSSIATTVHCTNLLGASTQIRVEFYDWDGILKGVGTYATLTQYTTRTITGSSTGNTLIYSEDVFVELTDSLNQGVVRVLKKGTGRIICAAQVLDAVNNPPVFVTPLPNFGPTGLF